MSTALRKDPIERAISLAMLFASRRGTVAVSEIREALYSDSKNDAAFNKMFSRDKENLRNAGLDIKADGDYKYTLDEENTYCDSIELTRAQAAVIAIVGYGMADEPLFPLPVALRLALAKITSFVKQDTEDSAGAMRAYSSVAYLSEVQDQPRNVEALYHAHQERKKVAISYTNSSGDVSDRLLCPYGLFLLNGRWYAGGYDSKRDDVCIFSVSNISNLEVTDETFEVIDKFDIGELVELPFRYGDVSLTATVEIIIPASFALKASTLTRNKGTLDACEDGSLLWTIDYRDRDALCKFVIENQLAIGPRSIKERAYLTLCLQKVVSYYE